MKLLNPVFLNTIVALGAITTTLNPALAQSPASPTVQPSPDCLSGYPQTSEQGRPPVSRYQFAVGFDRCLNEVTQPLQRENGATKTDLNQLTQRQQELNQELRQLGDRVDTLDPVPPTQ